MKTFLKIVAYCFGLIFIVLIIHNKINVEVCTPGEEYAEYIVKRIPHNAKFLCLVNFDEWSAQERFYIYDTQRHKYIYSGFVQHGNGRGSTARQAEFSNEIGSN